MEGRLPSEFSKQPRLGQLPIVGDRTWRHVEDFGSLVDGQSPEKSQFHDLRPPGVHFCQSNQCSIEGADFGGPLIARRGERIETA